MSFKIAKPEYKLIPDGWEGSAVCVDYTEPTVEETQFGKKERFQFIFQVQPEDDNEDLFNERGERLTIRTRKFLTSLSPRANLTKFVQEWFKNDNSVPWHDFDLEWFVGKSARVLVEHTNTDDGKTFQNISLIRPWKGATKHFDLSGYKRIQDRDENAADKPKSAKPVSKKNKDDGLPAWAKAVVPVGKKKGQPLADLDEKELKTLWEVWGMDNSTESTAEAIKQAIMTVDPSYDFEDDVSF